MGKTVAIIQARVGSSRLPAKALLPLAGHTVLDEVIERAQAIKGIDEVVLAIPEHDIELLQIDPVCRVVTGPEDDVLARYWIAANAANAIHVMRITADCPLLNPLLAAHVLDQYKQNVEEHGPKSWFYASNVYPDRTFPRGWDVEVFPTALLNRMAIEARNPADREHVTPSIQRWASVNGRVLCIKQRRNLSHVSYTLDTLDDYRKIYRLKSGIEERLRDPRIPEDVICDAGREAGAREHQPPGDANVPPAHRARKARAV